MKKLVASAIAMMMAVPAAFADTDVKFTLDWKFEAPSAPFFIAQDKGYFAEEGVNVTIDSGAGSRESIPRVATGAYDMGFGDINALIKLMDEQPDLKVKAVMMAYETPPFAVIGRKSQGISEDPKSLEGKTLGAPPPDAAFGQWPAFVEVAEIDTSGITIENVGFPVREPMLAQGQLDAIFGFSFSSVINLKAQGVPEEDITLIMMGEHGLDLYGNVVIANTDFAAENPEAVKGVIRALVRGYLDTIADPAASVTYVMKRNEVLDEAVETDRINMAVTGSIATDAVKESGFGDVDMARLGKSIEFLKTSMGISDTPPAPEDVFDPSYLPPLEERKVN
ncbi:NitT/TauT family transport system substrate-binding protein [Roseibium hamelinense]|uniref:NitT/TauT family transport system substrate-binding protein n=1 Tax=Roseibium hamelinense TaxID=150831 RepID=A0A562TA04_9HYPH|nr:ABC transporter substrate-binding protein [Roseibium hamelinense]MTI45120.1 ABC transporter substrate-binding protein [Roseibium hamelinense]TWI90521.1 NitT/TauT family transport system substrate-binding protein [Roseibium hamelinense]